MHYIYLCDGSVLKTRPVPPAPDSTLRRRPPARPPPTLPPQVPTAHTGQKEKGLRDVGSCRPESQSGLDLESSINPLKRRAGSIPGTCTPSPLERVRLKRRRPGRAWRGSRGEAAPTDSSSGYPPGSGSSDLTLFGITSNTLVQSSQRPYMGRYGGAPTAASWGEDCWTGPPISLPPRRAPSHCSDTPT